jgi:hypothetical protein
MRFGSTGLLSAIPMVYIVILSLVAIVHIVFAIAVTHDAKRFHLKGLSTFLVGPGMWGFATLMGGVWVALIYWIIHHSNLRSGTPPWAATKPAHNAPKTGDT